MTLNQQPSSEPSWVTVFDGSDRDWRLISMYELKELGSAINEDEPGHLKEMHDSGNCVIDKVRVRPYPLQAERHRPVCYPDCENEKHIQQKEREKVYRQLMAASINNENPGWVQIADIEKILNFFDRVIPDIENLQEFPFRSYPKKEHRQTQGGE